MRPDGLDPYGKPPDSLRRIFKQYQRATLADLDADAGVLDFAKPLDECKKRRVQAQLACQNEHIRAVIEEFTKSPTGATLNTVARYSISDVPGKASRLPTTSK